VRLESFISRRKHRLVMQTDKEVNLYEALGYAHARLARAGLSVRRLLRSESGQGTVEYVALVMLVALVMFGVVTAMKTYKFSEGQQLGDLIVKKIKEAVSKVKY
jgi:hypothetical protein